MATRPLVVLGATGSIGTQTLEVADGLGLDIAVLAARSPSRRLAELGGRYPEADVVVDEVYETRMIHPQYLEPRITATQVEANGRITVWANSQAPFSVRAEIAKAPRAAIDYAELRDVASRCKVDEKIHVVGENVASCLDADGQMPFDTGLVVRKDAGGMFGGGRWAQRPNVDPCCFLAVALCHAATK